MRTRRLITVWGTVAACVLAAIPAGAAPVTPNDPLFHAQWGLAAVGAPAAWATSTGKGITIGIVDTGADITHEDLAAKVILSTDCVGSGGDPTQCKMVGQDDNGHGTHVAGIAAAVTGNGKGIAGMAPDAKLLVAKALDNSGNGSISDISAGVHWVVDHGARVVNLSLGSPGLVISSLLGTTLSDAIEYAWSKGAVPVLAAGNASPLGFGSADYGNVDAIVVGGTGRDGAVAGYSSSTGTAKWALLAPGGSADGSPADDIMSTYWAAGQSNVYKALSGTDMAAPLVSGAVALLLANGMTPATAVSRLLTTVTPAGCGTGSANCHGALNVAAALAPATSPTTLAGHPSTVAPTTSTIPVVAPPATLPPTIPAPAIMSPSHPVPPTTASPPAAPRPAPGGNTTLKDTHAVALAPVGHHAGSSVVWFAVLAGLFVALGGAGLYWVLRMHPEPE